MFAIEQDVPLPVAARSGRVPIYPLRQMGVGDSFFVPAPHGPDDLAKKAYRLYFAVQNVRRQNRQLQFAVRRQGDRVGVWRTA